MHSAARARRKNAYQSSSSSSSSSSTGSSTHDDDNSSCSSEINVTALTPIPQQHIQESMREERRGPSPAQSSHASYSISSHGGSPLSLTRSRTVSVTDGTDGNLTSASRASTQQPAADEGERQAIAVPPSVPAYTTSHKENNTRNSDNNNDRQGRKATHRPSRRGRSVSESTADTDDSGSDDALSSAAMKAPLNFRDISGQGFPMHSSFKRERDSNSQNDNNVGDDQTTVFINGVPTRVESSPLVICPAVLFAPGVLLLDVTAPFQAERGALQHKADLEESLGPLRAEHARLRRHYRSLKEKTRIKRHRQHLRTQGMDADGEACADADGEAERSITEAHSRANEVLGQMRYVQQTLKNFPPKLPPPVLCLPSVHGGTVTLSAGHYYRTVKFVGEHLCLSGHLQPWLPQPCSTMSATPDNNTVATVNNKEDGAPPPWASMEMRALNTYLRLHPNSNAEAFLQLPTEEKAAFMM